MQLTVNDLPHSHYSLHLQLNSEGITFTGMCKELLHKLSFVSKDQLQPSHIDN